MQKSSTFVEGIRDIVVYVEEVLEVLIRNVYQYILCSHYTGCGWIIKGLIGSYNAEMFGSYHTSGYHTGIISDYHTRNMLVIIRGHARKYVVTIQGIWYLSYEDMVAAIE